MFFFFSGSGFGLVGGVARILIDGMAHSSRAGGEVKVRYRVDGRYVISGSKRVERKREREEATSNLVTSLKCTPGTRQTRYREVSSFTEGIGRVAQNIKIKPTTLTIKRFNCSLAKWNFVRNEVPSEEGTIG